MCTIMCEIVILSNDRDNSNIVRVFYVIYGKALYKHQLLLLLLLLIDMPYQNKSMCPIIKQRTLVLVFNVS